MKVKLESEKFDLKVNIQKTKIMVSGPITSWEIEGLTVNTMSNFFLIYFLGVVLVLFFRFYLFTLQYFIGFAIHQHEFATADSDCSHEIKRRLLLGRKVMTNQS